MKTKNTHSREENIPQNSPSTPLAAVQIALLDAILPLAKQRLLDWFQRLLISEPGGPKFLRDSQDGRVSKIHADFHAEWQNTCQAMLNGWEKWHENLAKSILTELENARRINKEVHIMWQVCLTKMAWIAVLLTAIWAPIVVCRIYCGQQLTVLRTQLENQAQEAITAKAQTEETQAKLDQQLMLRARLNLYYDTDGSVWVPSNTARSWAMGRHPVLYQVAPPNR